MNLDTFDVTRAEISLIVCSNWAQESLDRMRDNVIRQAEKLKALSLDRNAIFFWSPVDIRSTDGESYDFVMLVYENAEGQRIDLVECDSETRRQFVECATSTGGRTCPMIDPGAN